MLCPHDFTFVPHLCSLVPHLSPTRLWMLCRHDHTFVSHFLPLVSHLSPTRPWMLCPAFVSHLSPLIYHLSSIELDSGCSACVIPHLCSTYFRLFPTCLRPLGSGQSMIFLLSRTCLLPQPLSPICLRLSPTCLLHKPPTCLPLDLPPLICSPWNVGGSAVPFAAVVAVFPLLERPLTYIHIAHANLAYSISFNTFNITRMQNMQYHSHSYRSLNSCPSSQTYRPTPTHSIHSTHLKHLSLSHTHIISPNVILIHLHPALPTHTLPSKFAYSFLDSQFGLTLYVGLLAPKLLPM